MTLLSVTELYENHADNLGLHWLAGKENNRFLQLQTDQRIGNVGYLNLIHPHQIQVISLYELAYLEALSDNVYEDALKQLFENANLACIIVVDSPRVPDDLKRYAEHYHVPLFTSQVSGETLMNYLHGILGRMSGEKIILHGVFLDVFGMGVLITGDSGTGKSELALELVSRGHRLVADDAPEFSRIDHGVIRGTCPVQGMTPFLEVRGLGILNVQALFGDSAIKKDKYLRLIIKLEHMSPEQLRQIDRLQGDYRSRQVLGVEISEVGLPVAAGRNLAVLLECAVRNHSLKMQGYNAADEFCQRQTRAMYNMDKDEGYVSHRFDVY